MSGTRWPSLPRWVTAATPGIDDLVTTADPTVIYLSTGTGWLEGRATD